MEQNVSNASKPPLLSIGLPVFNGQNYLDIAIRSLLSQSFTDFELIICDNASTDRTSEICQQHADRDGRIRYLRHPANLGAAPNFNRCFELATGKYFKWAAHDDICLPDYLSLCVQHLESNPEVALCHTQTDLIDPKGNVVSKYSMEDDEFSDPDPISRFASAIDENHGCVTVFGVARHDVLRKTTLIGSYIGSDRNLIGQIALQGRIDTLASTQFQSRDHGERSIRAMSLRDRAAWFDTSKTTTGDRYFLHMLRAHAAALFRARLGAVMTFRGILQLVRWAWSKKGAIVRELLATARSLAVGTQPARANSLRP
jgi:glycosyltransferase involved in cell wall biosynthesis